MVRSAVRSNGETDASTVGGNQSAAVPAESVNLAWTFQPKTQKTKVDWRTFSLAFQSIGVIYGDLGTSPLYVFQSTFPDGDIRHVDDVLGALSLIIYTLILLPLIKYVFIILWANDDGNGGTFALYSLLCRHAKVSMIPNHHPQDRDETNHGFEASPGQGKLAMKVRDMLEDSKIAQHILFLVTILGTSMVIGDGILTPSISVLSAMNGINELGTDAVVWVSIAILIVLFAVQFCGTDKVGFTFAPILSIWFLLISVIGVYNLFHYDIGVLRAFNPMYIIDYFLRNGKRAWISLGGIFLCLTGTEAMFADLGHFNVRAVQISFSTMVFPPILIAYLGQAAFLRIHPDEVWNPFYASIPGPMYWPTFIVAVPSAIIASQAIISAAFAIISQSLSLGCFPRVKVVHTSSKYGGQVYIPEVNYILMVACLVVTFIFKKTEKIGNAFGIAVCFVMVITTCMVTLIMLVVWKTSIWKIVVFFVVFGLIELVYLSASLYKFMDGGFLPLIFSAVLMTIMIVWHYVHRKRYAFELKNKASNDCMRVVIRSPDLNRVPGIALVYSELLEGIPSMFLHFIKNMPSMHSVIVFISIKFLPISEVAAEERFIFQRVECGDQGMYRCVVRSGYKDAKEQPSEFERSLIQYLVEFIRKGHMGHVAALVESELNRPLSHGGSHGPIWAESSHSANLLASGSVKWYQRIEEEVQLVQNAAETGIVYLFGEMKVKAREDASFFKKIVVNHVYDFLRKNLRSDRIMLIPHSRLLSVGMTCEI
ncbi:Potassium transporter 5-like protein [Drosera capensis]